MRINPGPVYSQVESDAIDREVIFQERYEERAAILEFDAGMNRAEAEKLAVQMTKIELRLQK